MPKISYLGLIRNQTPLKEKMGWNGRLKDNNQADKKRKYYLKMEMQKRI